MLEQLLQELNIVTYRCGATEPPMAAVSAEIEALTGYPQRYFLEGNHSWDDQIYPADGNKKQQSVVFCLNEKIPYAIEYRIAHADGSIRWVLDQGRGDYDTTGKPIGRQGILSDITEDKKQVNRLKARKEAYKDQAAEFEAILDHMPGLVFYKDRNNCFIRVNKVVAEAYGLSKEALEGKNLNEIYSQEVADTYYRDDLEVINSGEPRLNIVEKWQTKDSLRWVNTSKIPFRDEDGEIIGIIGMSFDITERIEAEEREHQSRLEMEKLYQIDMLTRVFNRRSFFERAERNFIRYQAEAVECAVMMLDIDFFKQINDTYGHAAGDQALQRFAELCKENIRKSDLIGRIGGEEFAICLDHTRLEEAIRMAERLRESVDINELMLDNGAVIRFTVSIGLAMPKPSDQGFADILKRADTAMYIAKNKGRNRVEINL